MKKQTYYYYNCNPLCRITDDCVVRAISASTGIKWGETIRALAENSIKTGHMIHTPENYGRYLEERGYIKQKQPRYKNGRAMKFKDFVKLFDGHAVCRCNDDHVTYVADNAVWDIWDVSDQIVGDYWVYKTEAALVSKTGE